MEEAAGFMTLSGLIASFLCHLFRGLALRLSRVSQEVRLQTHRGGSCSIVQPLSAYK